MFITQRQPKAVFFLASADGSHDNEGRPQPNTEASLMFELSDLIRRHAKIVVFGLMGLATAPASSFAVAGACDGVKA